MIVHTRIPGVLYIQYALLHKYYITDDLILRIKFKEKLPSVTNIKKKRNDVYPIVLQGHDEIFKSCQNKKIIYQQNEYKIENAKLKLAIKKIWCVLS